MFDHIAPDHRSYMEEGVSNAVCPNCSWQLADQAHVAGTEAKRLSDTASTITLDMSQLLGRLAEIMVDFKQAVSDGGQEIDGEFGNSLGAILTAVEQVREEKEKVASLAVATSSARLARTTEALRLDIRSLMQAKTEDQGSI